MRSKMRPRIFNFRLSEGELRAVEIMSIREGVSLSEMMRLSLRESAQKRGLYSVGLGALLDDKSDEEAYRA